MSRHFCVEDFSVGVPNQEEDVKRLEQKCSDNLAVAMLRNLTYERDPCAGILDWQLCARRRRWRTCSSPAIAALSTMGTSKRSFARRWMLLPLGLRKLLTAR